MINQIRYKLLPRKFPNQFSPMKKLLFIFLLFLFSTLSAQTKKTSTSTPERFRIADEMEKSIKTELLNKWYPQSVDTIYGGFLTTFTYDFKPTGPQDKFIVTQARHTWTTAKAAQLYPDVSYYLMCSNHGYRFLRDVMWDKTFAGFYSLVDRQGHVKINPQAAKDAYGNAFGIYALAAYYKASRDTGALSLVKKAFLWLEKHSHDPVHKGYYQHLNMDGTPVIRDETTPSNADLGYKDQNSSIHLLEAFTELYGIWPDALVRRRLEEMLYLIRDKITTEKGYLTLFFKPDWTPVSFKDSSEEIILKHRNLDHVSFGHDVETAYLMLEASHELSPTSLRAVEERATSHRSARQSSQSRKSGGRLVGETRIISKRMVDHALKNGWDNLLGGFYDEGYYFKGSDTITIIRDSKNWWTQAEGINTLLLMADQFPDDSMHYYEKFKQLWTYIQTYLIDHVYGDWYEGGLDKEPEKRTALKGHIWKATYHHFRSLSNCVIRLRGVNSKNQDTSRSR